MQKQANAKSRNEIEMVKQDEMEAMPAMIAIFASQCLSAYGSTVGSHLSKYAGTKGCSYNWNVQISEKVLFVYNTEYFPFAGNKICIIVGVR